MFYKFFITFFIILFIFTTFFISLNITTSNQNLIYSNYITISSSGFAWPIPGYTKVTSPFGKRDSPTAGASSYHYGTDIGAPDGEITFLGFLGAGGYTLTLSFYDFKITYCHISPNFLVSEGDFVSQGQIIANVGPKYVYGVPGNKYTDSTGRPTNGATTGTHLHLGMRINDKYVNPLDYF